ncbi:hypothetical protein D3C85_1142520 [compost metagenome]
MVIIQGGPAIFTDLYSDHIVPGLQQIGRNLNHFIGSLLTAECIEWLAVHIQLSIPFQAVAQDRSLRHSVQMKGAFRPHGGLTARVRPNLGWRRFPVIENGRDFPRSRIRPAEAALPGLPTVRIRANRVPARPRGSEGILIRLAAMFCRRQDNVVFQEQPLNIACQQLARVFGSIRYFIVAISLRYTGLIKSCFREHLIADIQHVILAIMVKELRSFEIDEVHIGPVALLCMNRFDCFAAAWVALLVKERLHVPEPCTSIRRLGCTGIWVHLVRIYLAQ